MAWGRLALLQAGDDEQALSKLAEVFGYAPLPDTRLDNKSRGIGDVELKFIQNVDAADTVKRAPALFPRVNKIIAAETGQDHSQQPAYLSDPGMRLRAADAPPGTYRFTEPAPLQPMARLLPSLFNGLAQAKSGSGLDYRPLLKRIEQGRALQRPPERQVPRWPKRLQIIVDASRRLEPFWADFEQIVRHLQKLLGEEAVQALRFDEDTLGSEACHCVSWPTRANDHWRRWQAPPADVSILILGDLGVSDSRAEVAWRRQLATLQPHPGPVLTLSPAFRSPDNASWNRPLRPNPLNDCHALPRHPLRKGFAMNEPPQNKIDEILTWLAPLPLIDTGLLRRLRIALHWGDSALETVIWNHASMRDIGLGKQLQAHAAEYYQQYFRQRCAGSPAAATYWAIVEDHHKQAFEGLRQLNRLKQCELEQQDAPEMLAYFRRLCASVMQGENDSAQRQALKQQCRTVLASLSNSMWNSGHDEHRELCDLAYDLFAVVHCDEIRAGQWPEWLPPGFNPERLQWLNASNAQQKQKWQIVQIGDQGQIQCAPGRPENKVLTPVAEFEVVNGFPPRLTFSGSEKQLTQTLQDGLSVTLPENAPALFEAGALILELEAIRRPGWASRIWRDAEGFWCAIPWLNQEHDVFWQVSRTEAKGSWAWPEPFGEDAFGLYAVLSVSNVTQRFRWIEPGTFLMGSPEDETEREWYGMSEGMGTETLHSVTLTQGFWLADTTVTQAFWQAVMGSNTSFFQDNPENPVEHVSWLDAQRFIERLNSLCPGLSAMLPSEAQWEYACRAGTATPFSFGANIAPEQVNFNGFYPYADVNKGLNRQQTVPVKPLPPNPWGLYEMHGNVWEWCADAWQQTMSDEPVTDPLNTASGRDAARVVRGGSWLDGGRDVRSAARNGFKPADRGYDLGFRLALGHVEFRPGQGDGNTGQEAATDGGSGRRVAEQRQTGPLPVAGTEQSANLVKRLTTVFGKGTKKKK